MPFYGNITDRKNQFTYDKIYNSFDELYNAALKHGSLNVSILNNLNDTNSIVITNTTVNIGKDDNVDGVMLGRYILIDYNYLSIVNNKTSIDRENYDIETYGRSYDSTVWQKIYDANLGYSYTLIADLKTPPIDEFQALMFGDKTILTYPNSNTTTSSPQGNNILYRKEENGIFKYYESLNTNEVYYSTDSGGIVDIAKIFNNSGGIVLNTNQINSIKKYWPDFYEGGTK